MKTLTLKQKVTTAGRRALLQSGGEGAVYVQGNKAIKLYHHTNERRSAKLLAFSDLNLARRLPPNVLSPQRLLFNSQGVVDGFEMTLLPATAQAWKKLSQPLFCRRYGRHIIQELDLILELRRTLKRIHAQGVVVGDLNDHNIYFDLPALDGAPAAGADHTYWIDVDSFQFAGFPCPVALVPFLDPRLYNAGDFAARPVFSRESDWYAFAVLLFKTLLKVHPYGGVHHQIKSLQERARARISILDPQVTYPKAARPAAVLDDPLLDYLHQVFEEDSREAVPEALLQGLRRTLTACPRCSLHYASSRPHCPACHKQSPRVNPTKVSGSIRVRTLLQISGAVGIIAQLFVRPTGRIIAVMWQGGKYQLIHLGLGGVLEEMPLFSGPAGARFGLFQDILVVNPAGRQQLLLIDVSGQAPRPLETIASERFESEAVFAATPEALYRIANGCVLRGRLRHGKLLEEIVTTAHRWRTQLWASPRADVVAGYHHLLTDHHFFVIDDRGNRHSISTAGAGFTPARTLSSVGTAWGAQRLAFLWHDISSGDLASHVLIADHSGRTLHQATSAASVSPYDRLDGKLVNGATILHPTDGGVLKVRPNSHALLDDLAETVTSASTLHWHPRGLLIQESGALFLAETL